MVLMTDAFKKWGQEGGVKRSKNLSRSRRRAIARQAAGARWGTGRIPQPASVRLTEGKWDDPVFLEEVLHFGGLASWRELRERIENRPFGEEAEALEKVLQKTEIYGVTSLWTGLLKKYRGT